MPYTLTGQCPRCGAPIYAVTKRPEALVAENAPSVHYTCACHLALPAPLPDTDDEDPFDSLDVADRALLERLRTTIERAQ